MTQVFVMDTPDVVVAPEPMQLWWALYRGQPVGVFTDRHGSLPAGGRADVIDHLGRTATIVKCLGDDRLAAITQRSPREADRAIKEITPDDWGTGAIVVDGELMPTATVTYHGVDFTLGRDVAAYPFCVVRPVGGGDWPPLHRVPA